MDYALPNTLNEALVLRAAGNWRLLAGGTDVYPSMVGRPRSEPLLDLSRVSALRDIGCDDEFWRLGALVTWSKIRRATLPPVFNALKQAAVDVGGIQVQNAGTVAGNLCHASPAADGVPPLLAVDAQVELHSTTGVRQLPLDAFILGNRQTALRNDEVMTAILIPRGLEHARSQFVKLGGRRYLVISIAMAAASIVIDADERIEKIAIAIGACSATAQRVPVAESRLVGRVAEPGVAQHIVAEDLVALSPIDDLRGSAEYRRQAALEISRRAVRNCLMTNRS